MSAIATALGSIAVVWYTVEAQKLRKTSQEQLGLSAEQLKTQKEELELAKQEVANSSLAQQHSALKQQRQVELSKHVAMIQAAKAILRQEYKHLKTAHRNVIGENPESIEDGVIPGYINQANERLKQTPAGSQAQDKCLIKNLKEIQEMRQQIREAYAQIKQG